MKESQPGPQTNSRAADLCRVGATASSGPSPKPLRMQQGTVGRGLSPSLRLKVASTRPEGQTVTERFVLHRENLPVHLSWWPSASDFKSESYKSQPVVTVAVAKALELHDGIVLGNGSLGNIFSAQLRVLLQGIQRMNLKHKFWAFVCKV